jgi:hypothetical protein
LSFIRYIIDYSINKKAAHPVRRAAFEKYKSSGITTAGMKTTYLKASSMATATATVAPIIGYQGIPSFLRDQEPKTNRQTELNSSRRKRSIRESSFS